MCSPSFPIMMVIVNLIREYSPDHDDDDHDGDCQQLENMALIMIMMMLVNLLREYGSGAEYDRLLAGSSDWSPDQTFRSED